MSVDYVGSTLNPDRRPENQLRAILGPDGLVAAMAVHHADLGAFIGALRKAPTFPMIEIVMPPFWRCHEDGHGYTVLEMEQYLRTTTKENAA